ncbi:Zn-finger protein [Ceratobasidium sp. AG-Ba]|nr:Zn-finger protein [Ceratobasidium sp. AG-Ba]
MPTVQDLRHFSRGVTTVKNWTGRESRDMVRQFLPVVVDAQAPADYVRMIRALIDFAHLAHTPRLTEIELTEMKQALARFHRAKRILVQLRVVKKMKLFDKIAKLHMLSHYPDDIRELGTLDGYSTEAPEHLHIIYVKIPWRLSNRRDPLPQMMRYVQRLEAIQLQRTAMDNHLGKLEGADEEEVEQARLWLEELSRSDEGAKSKSECEDSGVKYEHEDSHKDGREDDSVEEAEVEPLEPAVSDETYYPRPRITLARQPTARNVPGHVIALSYEAPEFIRATRVFLLKKTGQSPTLLPSSRFDVWHKATLNHPPPPFAPLQPPHHNVIRVRPVTRDKASHIKDAGLFDTALFAVDPHGFGIARYCVGRVRAIFTLPNHLRYLYPGPLAFLNLYLPFIPDATNSHGLYSTTPYQPDSASLVLPLNNLKMACHLAPDFSSPPTHRSFFLSQFYNHFTFLLLFYWQRRHTDRLDR